MYTKRFDEWSEVKKKIEKEERVISLRKGDVRWCSVGVNVGMEIDGKGAGFTRPVLVLRVIGAQLALVVPLSTKIKSIPGYITIEFQGKTVSVCANHIKMVSQKRIYERQGKISESKFLKLREEIFKFLL
jgi:mRNA interferase MazF